MLCFISQCIRPTGWWGVLRGTEQYVERKKRQEEEKETPGSTAQSPEQAGLWRGRPEKPWSWKQVRTDARCSLVLRSSVVSRQVLADLDLRLPIACSQLKTGRSGSERSRKCVLLKDRPWDRTNLEVCMLHTRHRLAYKGLVVTRHDLSPQCWSTKQHWPIKGKKQSGTKLPDIAHTKDHLYVKHPEIWRTTWVH